MSTGSEFVDRGKFVPEANVWPQNRLHHRYKLEPVLPVIVRGSTQLKGCCRNIGVGGACLQLSCGLSLGDIVELEIRLPSLANALRLRATVRHANSLRCGVEFLGLSARERELIERFGEQQTTSAYLLSPDPEIVRSAQHTLQEAGLSMVRRGAPRSLPLCGPHLILIDSDWPDYIEVVRFLREEKGDDRLIVVALLADTVTCDQSRELAAHMTLPKPITQAWFRKALATAATLLRSE